MRTCNVLFHAALDAFAFDYLEAVEAAAEPRYLATGPFLPVGPWAEKMHLATGAMADAFLNIVVSPMGIPLGMPKTQADLAPDTAEQNPQLAAQQPGLIAATAKATEETRLAYVPETVFQSLKAQGQTNIAVLKPIRAKRPQLELDLEILETYDAVFAPSDVAERFRQLGVKAIACDPSDFGVTIKAYLP
jgi:hypothetical protein